MARLTSLGLYFKMAFISRKFLLIVVLLFAFTSVQPDVSNKTEAVTVAEEEPFVQPCTDNDGIIVKDVHWYKKENETPLKPPPVDRKGNSLMFPNIALGDAGTYVCEKNDDNSVVQTIELTVTPISNKPEAVTVAEEEPFVQPCTDNDGSIVKDVHWYKNENKTPLKPPQVDGKGRTLMFPNITLGDAGTYVCEKNDDNSVVQTIELTVTPKCPDFTAVDKQGALETFSDFLEQHFNDVESALDYRECLKEAVTSLIIKQNQTDYLNQNLSDTLTKLKRVKGNLTDVTEKLQQYSDKEDDGYSVTMQPKAERIPPGNHLVVWCNVTDSEGDYTFSWFWAVGDGYNFDWPPGLNKTNAITVEHNYSKLYAPSAKTSWSGRFFCLVEKNGGNDVPRLHHVIIEVANPIQSLHLIGNGKHSNITVPIVLPHGSPLEVNCTATGKWAPPSVRVTAQIGEDQQYVDGNSSDPKSKTTTANFTIPWEKIEGKNVKFFCEAKDNQDECAKNTSSEVIVINPIQSLHLIWTGKHSDQTVPIVLPRDAPLEVNCTATGEYATPEAVIMSALIDKKAINSNYENSSDSKTKTTTARLTIPWEAVNGKNVTVSCQAKGERNSNPNITSSTVKVSSATPSTDKPTKGDTVPTSTPNIDASSAPSESSGMLGTPTVFGGIATVLLVVAVIGVLVVAYRSRDKLRSWIMEKDVSKAALRKAKYARARGGRGWIKYAKLPRDISEAMSHNE